MFASSDLEELVRKPTDLKDCWPNYSDQTADVTPNGELVKEFDPPKMPLIQVQELQQFAQKDLNN